MAGIAIFHNKPLIGFIPSSFSKFIHIQFFVPQANWVKGRVPCGVQGQSPASLALQAGF